MRTLHLSAALLAAMFAGGLAYAEETIDKIKSVDADAGTVTLEDGSFYTFNESKDRFNLLSGYKPGDAVKIEWEGMDGDAHRATEMSPAGD